MANQWSPASQPSFDINGDGKLDIVVSVLGNIMPSDELIGEVLLFLKTEEVTTATCCYRTCGGLQMYSPGTLMATATHGFGSSSLRLRSRGRAASGKFGRS